MAIKASMPDKSNDASGKNPWIDWFENHCVVDLILGCDENCVSRDVITGALGGVPKPKAQPDLHSVNYAALHDELLESLLYEQAQMQIDMSLADPDASKRPIPEELSSSTFSSTTNSSFQIEDDELPSLPRKRRRAIRLHRRKTPPKCVRNNKVIPVEDHPIGTPLETSSSSLSAVNFLDLSKSEYPHPSHYLHPQCRMQKDKGKGEAVGANICAKGRDKCLSKLRTKMHLLMDHAIGGDRKGPATIKRRKAKVSQHYENFIETRSMIELKMGFLSMQYGVLLRWDTGRTGKVALVVLRKMCHESFYTKQQLSTPPRKQYSCGGPYVNDVVGGINAILQRPDGTEVALLEPPYRVARPDTFPPTVLRLAVVDVSGLNREATWSMQLTYEGTEESFPLIYSSERASYIPKGNSFLTRTLNQNEVVSFLEIKLFEHRSRRRVHKVPRRLITTVTVPLSTLQAQPRKNAVPTSVSVPFLHDCETSVQLELLLQSEYAYWLNQELEARRQEESSFSWRRTPFFKVAEEEENESPWEWICCVC
jgi:hypothetical protein